MKKQIQYFVASILVGALLAVAGTGCKTAEGFGEDMEDAGEAIQDGVD